LIVLDVMMPSVDGFSAAAALADEPATAALPLLFLSARTGSRELQRAQELGAVGYVTKPFEPLQLTQDVARFLDRLEQGELDELRREFRADPGRA
jgi:CheY-like chemotaxis protein